MTLKLILMRHAKSSWSGETRDHDRPLNDRGIRSAQAIGKWLEQNNHIPDQTLCSSAARTQETCGSLGVAPKPDLHRDLYLADPATMQKVLSEASGETVLMVAHNPGSAWFADRLVSTAPDHPRFADYPTCATLVVSFEADSWADVTPGSGTVIDFVVPRDLTD